MSEGETGDRHDEASDPDAVVSIDDGPEIEEEAKGSRFLGQVFVARTGDVLSTRLDEVRSRYPDATHHCWGARLGSGSALRERADDDGEPGRTAGAPILQALISEDVTDALIVVTRYYGGTNLGKGGLIRAYGSAARTALAATPRRITFRYESLMCEASFEDLGAIEGLLQRHTAWVRAIERTFDPAPRFRFEVRSRRVPALVQAISDATAGRVRPTAADGAN